MSAPTQEQPPQPYVAAAKQQGSRWLHGMPTEEVVKEWFDTQRLHKDMHHEPYYGGIVIIAANEKYKETVVTPNRGVAIREGERQVFTPYVKVDTRIAYFWDLVEQKNKDGEFVGVIEPTEVKKITNPASPFYNEHLPDGYFVYAARGSAGPEGNTSYYIGARWSVSIYERQSYHRMLNGDKPLPILKGIGTKQTLIAKAYPDDNALMKAETGAIGRALGVAGILVVGTGIATAEDMQEMQANNAAPPIVNREGAELPAVIGPGEPDATTAVRIDGPDVGGQQIQKDKTPQEVDEDKRALANTLSIELRKFPEAWEKYLHWYTDERGFPSLTELSGPALQGAVVKLERELDAAKNPGQTPSDDAAAPPAQ